MYFEPEVSAGAARRGPEIDRQRRDDGGRQQRDDQR